jgi:hypothetical protein
MLQYVLLLVLILFLLIRALKMKALPSFRMSQHVPTDAAAASHPRRTESPVFVFV